MNCRNVLVEDSRIEGSDDGLCFKSIARDGLARWPARDVVVRRCELYSTWCNAIQFGSATEVVSVQTLSLCSRKAGEADMKANAC